MKPDTPSPGQVNVAPEKSNLEAQPKESDLSRSETAPQPGSISAPASTSQPVQLPTDDLTGGAQTSSSTAQSDSSQGGGFEATIASLPAEDSGSIEPEWVDKAEEIIEKTADDPYHEDDAQHALSRAYLKKRFGLDVK